MPQYLWQRQKKEWPAILSIYYVLEEGEIARIATAHSMRRQGAASQMFRKLLDVLSGAEDNKNHAGSKRKQ